MTPAKPHLKGSLSLLSTMAWAWRVDRDQAEGGTLMMAGNKAPEGKTFFSCGIFKSS